MALTYNNAFEIKLRERLAEEIERQTATIAEGKVADWGLYQRACGQIAGLRQALDRCDEVHDELEKR